MRGHLPEFLLALVVVGAPAQVPSPRVNDTNLRAVPPKQGEGARPLTTEDLTAFVDGLVPIRLNRSDEAARWSS